MEQAELYACVYLREFPVQAVLRLRPELGESTCVVMEGERPLERVCSVTTKARLLGVRSGMNRTEVESFPGVKVLPRSRRMEQTVREVLLECVGAYSPAVEEVCGGPDGDGSSASSFDSSSCFLCVMDIAEMETLFGPAEVLARKVLAQVRSLGMQARVVVSRNFHAAVCLAKAASVVKGGTGRRAVEVIAAGDEARALATLPIDVLLPQRTSSHPIKRVCWEPRLSPGIPVSEQQREVFGMWGIETLGQLAALPEAELVARLGQEGRTLQQMARGELPHLFRQMASQLRLEERQELEFPQESLESLMFGVAVMVDQLIVRAKARLVALAEVTVVLELEGGGTHVRRVRPAQATNEKQLWVRLLHLELQAHPPKAAVVAVVVAAEPSDRSKVQMGLCSPALPESARPDVTLPQLQDVPERAAVRCVQPAERVAMTLADGRPREFWFREQRVVVEHSYGPWKASGEWWNDRLWKVEEWDVVGRVVGAGMMCCSVTRDLCDGEWRVTGLYD